MNGPTYQLCPHTLWVKCAVLKLKPYISNFVLARSNLYTNNANIKSSSVDNAADFGRANAVNGAVSSGWKGDFVSGAAQATFKRKHWIEIKLVNEMDTVGVKVTAMINPKATDIFQKTYVRAGMVPTTNGNGDQLNTIPSHMDVSVYYEGPLGLGQDVHLLYDAPVKTKYVFLDAHLDAQGRWGFAEIRVLVGEPGLIYCVNADPISGLTTGNKRSVNVLKIFFFFQSKESIILSF